MDPSRIYGPDLLGGCPQVWALFLVPSLAPIDSAMSVVAGDWLREVICVDKTGQLQRLCQ